MKKKTGMVACAIIIMLCILQGLGQLPFFREWGGFRYYKLETGVSLDTADRIQAGDDGIPQMAVWSILDHQTVSISTPVARKSKVSVAIVCGNPEYLTGNFAIPRYGDTKNCLVDEKTARALFGAKEAVGETVYYQGREYQVKGILEDVDPTLVIQAPSGYEGTFDRITVPDNGGAGDWELENRLQNRYGIAVEKCEWGIVRGFVKVLFCVMALAIYFAAAKRICCIGGNGKQRWKIRTVRASGMIMGIVLFFLLLWMTGIRGIPAEYLPSQWSDFGFYEKLWSSLGESFKNLLRLNLSTFELRMVQNSLILCLDILFVGLLAWYMSAALCDKLVLLSRT